jgi:quercetin dioxygenase-like cupin family protein
MYMKHVAKKIRRIVTRHDENANSEVWMDDYAANAKTPTEDITSTLLWSSDEMPIDYMKNEDYGARIIGTAPPANGIRFTIFEMAPHSAKSMFHKTDTLDYVVCLEGEMIHHMDKGFVTLKPGDVLIQRGTNHCWENRGDVPARLVIVLVDGKPKRTSSISGKENAR